jgi:hypothetical protein
MPTRHLAVLLLAALAAAPVAAQYKWRDANGRMVYSDLPPPASVAPRDVLRTPARPAQAGGPDGPAGPAGDQRPARASATAPAARAAQATPAGANPLSAADGAADRELEFRKRRLERAETQKKQAEAAAAAQRAAANCEAAREEIRTLETGMRMARVDERGERQVLDDEQRAARLANARKVSREACKAS